MTDAMPKLQVLVVDDSPVYRKLIEHALEDGGYTPLFAQNGREALDLYGQHAPAIVITDWMMPDFSGGGRG
jgi:CheY-like chemotaxis protein